MKKYVRILVAALALVALCRQANAVAIFTISDGVGPAMSFSDNGPGDFNPTPGLIHVTTSVGVWYLDINTAITKPLIGSATQPTMDIQTYASSSAAGSLNLTFSDNFFGPATGILQATASGHVTTGAPVTANYGVYGDPGNALGVTSVPIALTGTAFLPTILTGFGPVTMAAPYSLTQVLTYTATGPTTISTDASFHVVPEPSALCFGGLALALLVFRSRP